MTKDLAKINLFHGLSGISLLQMYATSFLEYSKEEREEI